VRFGSLSSSACLPAFCTWPWVLWLRKKLEYRFAILALAAHHLAFHLKSATTGQTAMIQRQKSAEKPLKLVPELVYLSSPQICAEEREIRKDISRESTRKARIYRQSSHYPFPFREYWCGLFAKRKLGGTVVFYADNQFI